MELAALITINIICLALIYFILSMRFSAAIKRIEETGGSQQLMDNVKTGLEIINLSIAEMDRKNETFYQLTERADALKRELEELQHAGKKRGKKKQKSMPLQNEAGPVFAQVSDPAQSADVRAFQRVLDAERDARLDLTRQRPARSPSGQEGGAGPGFKGVLEGAGRIFMKLFGVDSMSVASVLPAQNITILQESNESIATHEYELAFPVERRAAFLMRNQEENHDLEPDETELLLEQAAASQSQPFRLQLVQKLLATGLDAAAISSRTGIPLAEIEFMQSLPSQNDRPRRFRK